MKGLRSPLFFDPAYCYYNNSIAGVLARYDDSTNPSYVEFAMDYTGMRSFDTRESFAIMSSGKHSFFKRGWLSYGYDFYMGHYAKDYNPDSASTQNGMLPYHTFVSRTSVICLIPVYYPRAVARLVSCYALFE